MDCREQKLKEVMALDFKLYDMQLYLDTHPYDDEMIDNYESLANEAKIARKNFEEKYGPLCSINGVKNGEWAWIENPWPWEREV